MLPLDVQLLFTSQLDMFELLRCLQIYKDSNSYRGGHVLHVYTFVVLPTGLGSRFGDWPYMEGQYIALEVYRIMVTFVYKWKVLVK
jgi:hypothetical protein